MSQTFTKVLSKILTAVFVFSVIIASLPATAAESKNSIDDLKKIQNNIREKDPFKIKSQKIISKSKNVQVSNQSELSIEIDQVSKKINIINDKKGNTLIDIPNRDKLTEVQTIDNQVIFSNKEVKFDVIVEAIDGGVRQIINLKDSSAPSTYDFPIELLNGEKLIVNKDGSAKIVLAEISSITKEAKTKTLIAKPWAKSADGKELPTTYEVVGNNILRQKIDLKEAIFPVVADPIWCGNAVSSTSWLDRGGVWSASIIPTSCGAWGGQAWYSWEEAYSKIDSAHWDRNTNYWSMYNQYACHVDFAKGVKTPWNIEPSKSDKGYWGFANFWDQCN